MCEPKPPICRSKRPSEGYDTSRETAMKIEMVSPERHILSGEAAMVVARTTDGDIAFEPGHIPLVGVLQPERMKVIFADGSAQYAAVHSGFVEVCHNEVSVLSDLAELASDIDIPRAEAARDRASAALAADPDDEQAAADLKRAEVRLEVVSLAGGSTGGSPGSSGGH